MVIPASPVDFPTADELAAFRAWLGGMSSRAAVEQFLPHERAKGASSRGAIGQVRRQLIAAARAVHRSDLADLLQAKPKSRRAREIPALIETLRHLRPPRPAVTDAVEQWLPARVSSPLRRAGIETVGQAAQRSAAGGRWWRGVPGLGRGGGEIVATFVEQHGAIVSAARGALALTAQTLRPLETLRAPRELDGSQGIFRAPRSTCVLSANNDYEAVHAWLSLYEAPATVRAYRKEAERLMLWCIVERGKALSSLTTEDAIAYRAFLRRPSPKDRWMGPTSPRSSPIWRPFQAALSPRSTAYALQVINAMYRWLIEQRYVLANPFSGIKVRGSERLGPVDASRAFTAQEWTLIRKAADLSQIADQVPEESHARLLFLLDFSYATGLRANELVSAKLGDIKVDDIGHYWLRVRGKRERVGEVSLPPLARAALERYLTYRGIASSPSAWDPQTSVVSGIGSESISASRLWRLMKTFFANAGEHLDEVSPTTAGRARRASPHWMRHTHASHALRSGVDVATVRDNLRHSNISVTSTYLSTDASRRAASIAKVFGR